MTAPVRPATQSPTAGAGSRTVQAAAQTPPPAPASATPTPRRGTPKSVRRLRRLQVVAVALLLAFGALVVAGLAVQSAAVARANASLAQYNRLAEAQVQALQVQQAANSWPLNPSEQHRGTVTSALTALASTLADASAIGQDRETIAPLTAALVNYSMTLQDALNAKGTESAALLAKADTQLSKELVQPLQAATTAAGDRVAGELTANWLYWGIGGFVVAGVGLIMVQIALARASHRYLNPGVALGLLGALVSVTILATTAGQATTAATAFTSSTRADLDAVVTARVQVNQARADELLSVALQADGGSHRTRWETSYAEARKALQTFGTRSAALTALTAYSDAHKKVTAAIDAKDWVTATNLVLSNGVAATSFTAADSAVTTLADTTRSPAAESVTSVGEGIVLAIAGVVLLTLAGAALAVWGVARRIEEYR